MKTTTFENLVSDYSDSLYRFSLSILKNNALAKDAVQEVFIKLWNSRDGNIELLQPKAYLFKMVRNKSIDLLRAEDNRKQKEQFALLEDQEEHTENDKLIIVKQLINRLPEDQREAITLRDLEGLKYEEIAQTTGSSLSKVKVLIFRGRQKIKSWIEKDEEVRSRIYG